MAIITQYSKYEIERVGRLCYDGKTVKVLLCNSSGLGYSEQSTVLNWQEIEISGTGYQAYTKILTSGTFVDPGSFYQSETITASFTCTGGPSLIYDKVVIYFEGQQYPSIVLTEDPNQLLRLGQVKSYQFSFRYY